MVVKLGWDFSENPPQQIEIVEDEPEGLEDTVPIMASENFTGMQALSLSAPVVNRTITLPSLGGSAVTWRNRHRRWFRYFAGIPTGIYIPRNTDVTITVHGGAATRNNLIALVGLPGFFTGDVSQRFGLGVGTFTIRPTHANSAGLLYFEWSGNSPITLTITGGMTNPLYIKGQTTMAQWRNMLTQVPAGRLVELMGDRSLVIVTRETAERDLTGNAPGDFDGNPDLMLQAIDGACEIQDEMSGIAEFLPLPHTRDPHLEAFLETPLTTFMAATEWYTRYNPVAIPAVTRTFISNGWGPWHEMGHQRQMPSWFWHSQNLLVEVTVNIYSLYVQREYGQTSRLELDGRWATDIRSFIQRGGDKNFDTDPTIDDFTRLGMFWQLDLSFGKHFYAKLHQMYRELPSNQVPNRGSAAARDVFIRMSSQCANRNLAPFYDRWGIRMTDDTRHMISSFPALQRPIWESRDLRPVVEYYIPSIEAPVVSIYSGGQGISLNWNQPESLWGHEVYQIFRNNQLLSTVTQTNFTDSGANQSVSNSYTVRAVNRRGYVSKSSNQVSRAPNGTFSSAPAVPELDVPAQQPSYHNHQIRLVTAINGSSVAIPNAAGTGMVLGGQNTNNNQVWELLLSPNGFSYLIRNVASGRFITGQNETLSLTTSNNANSLWNILALPNGNYRLLNENNGRAIDVQGSSGWSDGTPIISWSPSSGVNQQWAILPVYIPLPPLPSIDGGHFELITVMNGTSPVASINGTVALSTA
ncbi:MAG: M60 family metallopeptidase, partial [Turicibacter sp.]|nr:M60 family metallopeptidase [Turicibacter sp.]